MTTGDEIYRQILATMRDIDEKYPPGTRPVLFKMSLATLDWLGEKLVPEQFRVPNLTLHPYSLMGVPVKDVPYMPLGYYYVEYADGNGELAYIKEAVDEHA